MLRFLLDQQILKFLIVMSASLLIAACSNSSDESAGNSETNGYSAEATAAAVDQCTASGATQAICECVVKELQSQVSAEEMQKIDADVLAGKPMNEEFMQMSTDADLKCVSAS